MAEIRYLPPENSKVNREIEKKLNDTAKKERKSLLITSTAALFMALSGLIPSRINALGLEFTVNRQRVFLAFVLGAVIYFLLMFLIYSASDYRSVQSDWAKESEEGFAVSTQKWRWLLPELRQTISWRGTYRLWLFLEFVFPVAYACIATAATLIRLVTVS